MTLFALFFFLDVALRLVRMATSRLELTLDHDDALYHSMCHSVLEATNTAPTTTAAPAAASAALNPTANPNPHPNPAATTMATAIATGTAATPEQPPAGKKFTVVLKKRKAADGYGFSLLSDDRQPAPVFIMSIAEGSAAAKSRVLAVGDRILSINGENTALVPQREEEQGYRRKRGGWG